MANAKLILDKRYHRADGMTPILIQVSLFNKTLFFPTGVSCKSTDFSPTGGKNGSSWLQRGERCQTKNSILRHHLSSVLDALTEISSTFSNKNLSAAQLRIKFARAMDWTGKPEPMLLQTLKELSELKRGRTKTIYLATISKLKKHIKNDIPLEEVNKGWLERFQAKELQHITQNSIAIHLRNIRAAFNYAIDNDLTTSYPFRRFKIRQEVTAKRSLTMEHLIAIMTAECEPYQIEYRDMFLLSLFLIGTNPTDMLHLTRGNLIDGGQRIIFNRQKTHKLYNIKVEPEAADIFKKYKGKKFLLRPLDTWILRNWLRHCNDALKRLGSLERRGRGGKKFRTPIEPALTMYWARHTWATIAASIDIPDATISAALGHSHLNPITAIYVNFDQRKIDEANRRVIDYIFGNLLCNNNFK